MSVKELIANINERWKGSVSMCLGYLRSILIKSSFTFYHEIGVDKFRQTTTANADECGGFQPRDNNTKRGPTAVPRGQLLPPSTPPPPQSDTNSPSYGPRAERSPTRAVGAGGSVGRPRCALPSEALRLLWEFSALHTHTQTHTHTPRV